MKLHFYSVCMVLLSLLPGLTVSAQEQKTTAPRTVIVVDQAGPVIGASVVIKGTVSGASTDVNGVTTIACPDDAVLSVSYVGYSTQEVAVASRTTIEVRLEEDAQRRGRGRRLQHRTPRPNHGSSFASEGREARISVVADARKPIARPDARCDDLQRFGTTGQQRSIDPHPRYRIDQR